ncbi:MAG TPA: hypothetical protein PLZ78_02755 [Spirochaetota bacterium]|nr:hypothetical protein [Spirochaetota bacterium]
MNTKNPLLKEALRLAGLKRHEDAVLVLERLAAAAHPDPHALFLLAVEYLQSGAIGRIEPVLNRLRSLDRNYPPLVRLELFLYLKGAESAAAALTRYIEAIQRFPNDRHIIRAVSAIRRAHDFVEFQRSARLNDFVPLQIPTDRRRGVIPAISKPGRSRVFRRWLPAAIAVISICVFVFIGLRYGRVLVGLIDPYTKRPSRDFNRIDMATIDGSRHDLIDKIRRERTPVFYYSNEEVVADFNNARSLLKKELYNEALLLINKILNSNAGFSVRERAEFLKSYTLSIEERVFEPVAFDTVARSPYLYGGFSVEWSGTAANVKRKDGKLIFNLMMGKGPANTFTGIADVYCERDVRDLVNGDVVLIRALFVNNPGGYNRPYLVAREVRLKDGGSTGR